MSIHPTDQAYLAVLAGAEKVPEYGSTNGFMIPVRAMIKRRWDMWMIDLALVVDD